TGEPFGPPPDGVLVRESKSFYRNGAPKDAFAPRIGFAWQPLGGSGWLVLGGGYGWFYQAPPFAGNAGSAPLFTSPPFAQSFTNSDASNSASSLSQPFPVVTLGFVPRTVSSQLSDRVAGPIYRLPRLQQWNFTTKLKMAATSLDLGYVGSYGDRLLLAQGLNQPLLASTTNPLNCGYDGDPEHCITTNTSLNARQRVPILGETPTALLTSQFVGNSTYHSFQATFRARLAERLSLQSAYTLSKALNNTEVMNDQRRLDLAWGRASFDRAHRLITNFNYELPLPVSHTRFRRALLEGWSVSGIVIVQSGLPMTLTDPNAGAVFGRAGASTVTLCPGASYADLQTRGSTVERLGGWINTAAICSAPRIGDDGATGYGSAGHAVLNGPGQVNTDFSIGKRTRVGGLREDAELAFRAEFYNALNTAQFSNPGTTLGTASFGVITGTSVAPRLIQFGLKYLF
ncbi:MAG: hypothetical protein LC114_15890, partial [Bryobacterales bacterium]|nr:hypothetical protein [Bryobacterales bacterium]